MMDLRVGTGFDVHPFIEGRKLILGGVEIPHPRGLDGHSDADPLLHAVTDAVLGALGWDDIGTFFPNTDPQWKGVASSVFLREIWTRAAALGWSLGNCDTVVLAEAPKIKPYVQAIREQLATLFNATPDQIGVKATTMERLGFIGREEGIAAQAVVLLRK